LLWILITRYWRPKTLWYLVEKLTRPDSVGTFLNFSIVAADQIVMRYQPIMSVSEEECTGVEALARWEHPSHGLLTPSQFLEGAAQGAGSRMIGHHVLREAVAEASRWRQQFRTRPFPVHVNVSAHQLDDDAFADTVRDCLDESSLPAESLVLEVTDHSGDLSPAARAQLCAVADRGVQIAVSIDDDADSADEMSGWRDLPVSIVKLDGAARHEAERASGDRPETVIEMARRLGLRTVAERVEDDRQRDRLRQAGADSTQGYLHTQPISAKDLTGWLREKQPS
jgi:EAL domain-containing protein (putative c-di-GMP-specific phosphodiesterase class I)